MHRWTHAVMTAIALLALCWPAMAQDDLGEVRTATLVDPVWKVPPKGSEQFVGDVTWTFQNGERARRLEGTWFHFTGERQKTGVSLFGAKGDDSTTSGVGIPYHLMLKRWSEAALWGGGTVFAYGADAADVADGAVTLEVNYERYFGGVAAFRIGARYSEAVSVKDQTAADQMTGAVDAFIGFGLFLPQPGT